jgi:hypothetical protein
MVIYGIIKWVIPFFNDKWRWPENNIPDDFRSQQTANLATNHAKRCGRRLTSKIVPSLRISGQYAPINACEPKAIVTYRASVKKQFLM